MTGLREWAGQMMLRAPAPLRSLRNAPVIGGLIHRLSHRVVPADEKVWAQVESGPAKGIWMHLNPRTGEHYLRGDGETATQKALAARLRPGMVFYDIGANVGFFSLLGAKIVGPAGKVFSFEPDGEVASRLREHVAKNEFSNVTVTEAGVWSSTKMLNFAAAADSSSPDHGTGRIVANGAGRALRCISIDDFARSAPSPDAIKCDVEGAEVEVMRGAVETLRAHKPWIICETHSPECDRGCREILAGFGYEIRSVDEGHIVALPGPEDGA
jgi:FkbM family methyltransferase